MSRCFDRASFGPSEQFMGGYKAFPHLQVFFTVVDDLFCQLVGMRQKKVDVEGAGLCQHCCGGSEGCSFLSIGSSL